MRTPERFKRPRHGGGGGGKAAGRPEEGLRNQKKKRKQRQAAPGSKDKREDRGKSRHCRFRPLTGMCIYERSSLHTLRHRFRWLSSLSKKLAKLLSQMW